VAYLAAALALPTSAPADPPNAPDPGAYTTNGPVYAIARAAGRTYIGGDFTRVGQRSGSGVVLSPGGSRQAFPEVAGGDVRTTVSDGAGGWYIGGSFTAVGGESHVGLAHVKPDGTVDHDFRPVATNFSGSPAAVDALAYSNRPSSVDQGTLYVGGEFSRIGVGSGQIHQHLAALRGNDGSATASWGPVTDCRYPPCSATVRALAVAHLPLTVKNGTQSIPVVFAGGDFDLAGASDAPKPVSGLAAVWGVGAVDSSNVSIAGSLVSSPDPTVPWNPLSPGSVVRALQFSSLPSAPLALAVYAAGEKYGGAPLLQAHQFEIGDLSRPRDPTKRTVDNTGWPFNKWTPNPQSCVGAGCLPSVRALVRQESTIYFAGDFSTIAAGTGQVSAQRVAKIQVVPDPTDTAAPATPITATALGGADGPADGPVRAVAVSNVGGTLYLAGDFKQRLAALDTSSGAATGWAPSPDASAEALATDGSTSSVYAGGDFSSLGSQARAGLAAFESSGALAGWAPGVYSSDLATPPLVRSLAASDSTVYVGGRFDTIRDARGVPHTHANLAAIGATSEYPIDDSFAPNPSRSGATAEALSLSLLGSTLYVGGAFDRIGGQNRQNLAALDSTSGAVSGWNPGADANVYAILPACGAVYVGGGFKNAGGQVRNYVAAVDPASGSALPWNPGPDSAVFALTRFGPTIYAGGAFSTIAGQLRQKAAGLDVATGSATGFDPGADGVVRALATSDSNVYMGGTFSSIGNAVRVGLAALDPATGQAAAWDPEPDGPVKALTVGDGAVYAGGEFAAVGTTPQKGFAPFSSGAGSPFAHASCTAATATRSSPPVESRSVSSTGTQRAGSAREPAAYAAISRLTLRPTRLRLGGPALTVQFLLSRSSEVRLRFERQVRARCPAGGARRASRRSCARYVRFADVTGRGKEGVNRLSFPGQRVGRRRLLPGRYRLVLTPLPADAGAPRPVASFTVVS
jgi:hypothetical protein